MFNEKDISVFDIEKNILAPGLIDPHMHIESSMITGCAYAEAALLNGTTTIFCDSHEIGNVLDTDGIEWMLEDCRQAHARAARAAHRSQHRDRAVRGGPIVARRARL